MKIFTRSILAAATIISAATADDVRNTVAVVDDPAQDYLLICGLGFAFKGGGYSICKIDLNDDRLKDLMFANAETSGTGGRAATVYLARKDGKYTRIGTLGHGQIATETIKTGGKLLYCSWNGGGGHSSITTYLISHDGLKVVESIAGEWKDMNYKKLYDAVFSSSLKPSYRFVATKPKNKAEQVAAPDGE